LIRPCNATTPPELAALAAGGAQHRWRAEAARYRAEAARHRALIERLDLLISRAQAG
jgi:hypothetical protein